MPDLKKLVALRNQAARQAGLQEFSRHAACLERAEPAAGAQAVRRARRADARAVPRGQGRDRRGAGQAATASTVDELRPWHYHDPFFQEAPAVFGELTSRSTSRSTSSSSAATFYAGIGLPIDDVLGPQRSLREAGQECPHAFCNDIDREGDVRVLANIVPNQDGWRTMLHELGHSVYREEHPAQRCPTCCAPSRTR